MPLVDEDFKRAWFGGVEQTALYYSGSSLWRRFIPIPDGIPVNLGLDPANDNIMLSGNSLLATTFYNPWNRTTFEGHQWARLFRGSYAGSLYGVGDGVVGNTLPGYGNSIWTALHHDTLDRWNRPQGDWVAGNDARRDMAGFSGLIINEGEALGGVSNGDYAAPYEFDNMRHERKLLEDLDYMGRFITEARAVGARVFIWGNWAPYIREDPEHDTGWRARQDDYERRTHYRQDYFNRSGEYCYVIPANRMLSRLHDDALNGLAPAGISSPWDYHAVDDPVGGRHHPYMMNEVGGYAMHCIMWAVVFAESPVGKPFAAPVTAEIALYLQQTAWDIATNYARAGLGGSDMGAFGMAEDNPEDTPETILGDKLVYYSADPLAGPGQRAFPSGNVQYFAAVLPLHRENGREISVGNALHFDVNGEWNFAGFDVPGSGGVIANGLDERFDGRPMLYEYVPIPGEAMRLRGTDLGRTVTDDGKRLISRSGDVPPVTNNANQIAIPSTPVPITIPLVVIANEVPTDEEQAKLYGWINRVTGLIAWSV